MNAPPCWAISRATGRGCAEAAACSACPQNWRIKRNGGRHQIWELPNGQVYILAGRMNDVGHRRQNALTQIERLEAAYRAAQGPAAPTNPNPAVPGFTKEATVAETSPVLTPFLGDQPLRETFTQAPSGSSAMIALRQIADAAPGYVQAPTPADVEPVPAAQVLIQGRTSAEAQELVSLHDGQPVVTTLALAQGTENDHASVIKLVRAHVQELEKFGPIGFEIQLANTPQGGGRPTEYALLNEPQATLLITFMRNTDVVVDFKVRLVEGFYRLKAAAVAQATPALPRTYLEALEALVIKERESLTLKSDNEALDALATEQGAEIAVLRPKAAFHDHVAKAVNCISDRQFAKALGTGHGERSKEGNGGFGNFLSTGCAASIIGP